METYPILFDCRLFRRRICWETTCGSLSHNPEKYHNITEDWEGKKYAGIDLKWDYEKKNMSSNYVWIHLGTQKQIWTYNTKKKHNTCITNTAQFIMVLHIK